MCDFVFIMVRDGVLCFGKRPSGGLFLLGDGKVGVEVKGGCFQGKRRKCS